MTNEQRKIDISTIQNKQVQTEVSDINIYYGDFSSDMNDTIKSHIKTHGSICTQICLSDYSSTSTYYNNTNGALYVDNDNLLVNHSVSIIGWDDNYAKSNFKKQPPGPGAWIVRNSYGSDFGDHGLIYISYYDEKVYDAMLDITKADTTKSYDNLYQYDYQGNVYYPQFQITGTDTVYIGNKFQKATNGVELLTKVGISAPFNYTCKVFVNPNGASINLPNSVKILTSPIPFGINISS